MTKPDPFSSNTKSPKQNLRRSLTLKVDVEVKWALEKYADKYQLDIKQVAEELIEKGLMRTGFLPDWWETKSF